MTQGSWLALLDRQVGQGGPIGFDDIVVGHDFGLLGIGEIQDWLRALGTTGPLGAGVADAVGFAMAARRERAIARGAGLSQPCIANWLAGRRALSLRSFDAVRGSLGVPWCELLGCAACALDCAAGDVRRGLRVVA